MSDRPDLMQRLMLLRHDPDLAEDLRVEAMKGNLDAQYGLGLVYAEGRGVEQDEVEAFAWLSVAMLEGDPDAEELRIIVSRNLNMEQVRTAIARAGQYIAEIERDPPKH